MLVAGFELTTWGWRRGFIQEELYRESQTLLNLMSQRADQHDAHLTSLSALSQASPNLESTLFLEVAAAIQRFYPRVTAIDLVLLDRVKPVDVLDVDTVVTTRSDSHSVLQVARSIHAAALRSSGELVLIPSPANPERYLLVKRSPNNDMARHGLSLEIDVMALSLDRSNYWNRSNVSLVISLPDGTKLEKPSTTGSSGRVTRIRNEDQSDTQTAWPEMVPSNDDGGSGYISPDALSVSDTLNSRTQPLVLTARYTLKPSDLLPWRLSIGGPVILLSLLSLVVVIRRLMLRTRKAELGAKLSENEARISHASRVNSLGEMASGIAHELNQPLTAVLGQSQAGLRLLNQSDVDLERIASVLEANVAQAKRASKIMSRLRDWSSRTQRKRSVVSVNDSVANVVSLLDVEAQRASINLFAQLDHGNPQIDADAIELEQVVFNLVRNSLDALNRSENNDPDATMHVVRVGDEFVKSRLIRIETSESNGGVCIVVSDNGRGISVAMQRRLFEPFASDKSGGMGLGLALCERIVDRYNGRIDIVSEAGNGTTAKVVFPSLIR